MPIIKDVQRKNVADKDTMRKLPVQKAHHATQK